MKERTPSQLITDAMTRTPKQTTEAYIASSYIVDYGIVDKVNSDDTVDVKHAIKQVLRSGKVIEPFTLTPRIEVLWPSSKEFSMKFKLTKGDRVLLVGLKSLLQTVDVSEPKPPSTFHHYSQETLKAVPLCLHLDTAKLTVEADDGNMFLNNGNNIVEIEDGKVKIANQINSLGAVLDELMDALTTGWISINCVVGAPVTPLPTTITAINLVRTKLATLLKE